LTSSHSAAPRRLRSTTSSSRALLVLALDAETVGDVLVDGFGERVRLLEDHADALAQLDDVHARVVDVDPVDPDLAGGDARAVDQVVHAVEAAQERALAAAGGPDEGGDLPLGMLSVMSCRARAAP
jgi:hypothetical protein